jgi:predicted ATP-dependent serine protease
VLSRHVGPRAGGGAALAAADVFVSLAGGVRVEEPGADLAVALAVASAACATPAGGGDRPLACFGEVGLTGELRYVAHADRRVAEAARFGLERVVAPAACFEGDATGSSAGGCIHGAPTLGDALTLALDLDTRVEIQAA